MSASRSRQKRKLEPISIEELAGATGMSGFCTFLTRDPQVAVPVLDELQKGAVESSAPMLPAPETPAVDLAAVDQTASETTALDSRYGPQANAFETVAI